MLHALLLASALAAPSPPLVEVRKIPFETPYVPYLSEHYAANIAHPPPIVVSSRAPVAYALSHDSLFVLRTTDGAVLDIVDVGALAANHVDLRLEILEEGATPRLLFWAPNQKSLTTYSIADPDHPAFERRFDMSRGLRDVRPVLDGRSVVILDDSALARLLDLDLGDFVFTFPTLAPYPYGASQKVAVGGRPQRPLIGIYDTYLSLHRLTFYEMGPEGVAAVGFFNPGSISSIMLDTAGAFFVLGFQNGVDPKTQDARFEYQVRSFPWGDLASSIETAGRGPVAVLAEGGGGRALVTLDRAGVDVVDLSDPTAPAVVGRVEAGIGRPGLLLYSTATLAASRTAPIVFAGAAGNASVLTIDVGTALILSQAAVGPAIPVAVRAREGAGARELIVLGARALYPDFVVPGGTAELTFFDASSPTYPSKTGHLLRNQPRTVDATATLDGRFVLAFDDDANSLALVRAADGRVLDVTGHFEPWGHSWNYRKPQLKTGGRFVLLMDNDSWTEFELEGDRLRTVQTGRFFWEMGAGAVRADGAVVVEGFDPWFSPVLESHPIDGPPGQCYVQYTAYVDFSGDGMLAAVTGDFGGWLDLVDVADASSPRVLWSSHSNVHGAGFTQGGSSIFTIDNHGGFIFYGEIYEARSGAIKGVSAPVDYYYGNGLGTISESTGVSRAVVWKSFFPGGYATLVFDTGSPTPQLLATGPKYFGAPDFAPRPGGGWYETHRENVIVIGEPDGGQTWHTLADTSYQDKPRALRQGFFTTVVSETDERLRNITLWRDTALNRPPEARAGADRSVECEVRAGTPVGLDGSASSDPDSTPDTADDIASYAWSVDGGPSIEGPTATVPLALGAHAASLTVTDVLGADSVDDLVVNVIDTLPPVIDLRLEPILVSGLWANHWAPRGSASDRCDGGLGAPAERLTLPAGAASAVVSFARASTASIELRLRHDGGLEAKLAGPDEAALRATWASAFGAGGFPLIDGGEIRLALAPAAKGASADPIARYELTAAGRLASAISYGADRDLVVTGSAMDASGHRADASVSLRATIADRCALQPGAPGCR
ncbi:MAG TPA: PKD domain-containing protein [Candidatus Polarisedimenticolaceae bacterium]|nr:PKD domain-containing protein [Candidatus Polarisedimenticolaceae bacterium]